MQPVSGSESQSLPAESPPPSLAAAWPARRGPVGPERSSEALPAAGLLRSCGSCSDLAPRSTGSVLRSPASALKTTSLDGTSLDGLFWAGPLADRVLKTCGVCLENEEAALADPGAATRRASSFQLESADRSDIWRSIPGVLWRSAAAALEEKAGTSPLQPGASAASSSSLASCGRSEALAWASSEGKRALARFAPWDSRCSESTPSFFFAVTATVRWNERRPWSAASSSSSSSRGCGGPSAPVFSTFFAGTGKVGPDSP
mmetsp:Transcript_106132/g.296228  ORF Transcript_106132/g.296228 Transcript_106132/m.296228 type:complete len:260 (-) Transcript_106132:90-869(-)